MSAIALLTFFVPNITPKATVQALVDAVNRLDRASAARAVMGGKATGEALDTGYRNVRLLKTSETVKGDDATVDAMVAISYQGQLGQYEESLTLHRVAGDWQIVPTDVTATSLKGLKPLQLVATMIAYGDLIESARKAARRAESLIIAKGLALATIEYSLDHGDRLPDAAHFQTQVAPYLKHLRGSTGNLIANPFVVPYTPKGTTFFLDRRLSGLSIASIRRGAEVAMIVMGRDGQATFPFDGYAIAAYSDGHGARVSRAQLQRARTVPLK